MRFYTSILASYSYGVISSFLTMSVTAQQGEPFPDTDIGLPTFRQRTDLIVTYDTTIAVGPSTNGIELSRKQTETFPSLDTSTPLTGPHILIMIDPDAPSRANPASAQFLHYMQPGLTSGLQVYESTTTPLYSTKLPIVQYRGPRPPAGSGPHRYLFLLFPQPATFAISPGFNDSMRMRFDVAAFAREYQLGPPVAGTFFVAENKRRFLGGVGRGGGGGEGRGFGGKNGTFSFGKGRFGNYTKGFNGTSRFGFGFGGMNGTLVANGTAFNGTGCNGTFFNGTFFNGTDFNVTAAAVGNWTKADFWKGAWKAYGKDGGKHGKHGKNSTHNNYNIFSGSEYYNSTVGDEGGGTDREKAGNQTVRTQSDNENGTSEAEPPSSSPVPQSPNAAQASDAVSSVLAVSGLVLFASFVATGLLIL